MTDQTDPEAERRSEYVAALHREAKGYIVRGNTKGLEAVNRELVAQGEKPIKSDKKADAPAAAPKSKSK